MKNIALIAIILAVAGGSFYGGTQYQKTQSTQLTQAGSANGNGQFGAGRLGGAGTGRNARGTVAGASQTAGTILSKDKDSITVKLQDGSTKIVLTSPQTTINKSVKGATADLTTDTFVTVGGTTNTDGSITAATIRVGTPDIRQGTPSANTKVPTKPQAN
ncbi:MAG: hypothetical protein Q7S47_00360 [bacterium]|nr:hypothetical protein [bacterium]